jgi:2-oxoisovalerate dehydrogenase E1 component alpha subunit
MALRIAKSRSLINHLKLKMGSFGAVINNHSCWVPHFTDHHPQSPSHHFLRNPDAISSNKTTPFASNRFNYTEAGRRLDSIGDTTNDTGVLNFPGGKVKFTPEMEFISPSSTERIRCYRVLDDNGQPITNHNFVQISEEVAVKIYSDMATLQVMDTIFYEAQRQGRISFYLTTIGEEAINIASAAALHFDDLIFPQYREPGVLLWRGFTLQEFANQCFGNEADYGKGRQMPIHYGSNKHNYITVSSTIATQLPHAVGAAYALKMDGRDACTVTYFGDGGTSEVMGLLLEDRHMEFVVFVLMVMMLLPCLVQLRQRVE